MFEIITASTAAHKLSCKESEGGTYYGFTYSGALALIEYLDDASESEHGEEFDPIALSCQFSEYETAIEATNDHSGEGWEGTEQEALERLQDITTVIPFEGGIIMQCY